jgi:hypothetical protein
MNKHLFVKRTYFLTLWNFPMKEEKTLMNRYNENKTQKTIANKNKDT